MRRYNVADGFEYEKFLLRPTKAQEQAWHRPHYYLTAVFAADERMDTVDALEIAFVKMDECKLGLKGGVVRMCEIDVLRDRFSGCGGGFEAVLEGTEDVRE
ncbi:hypothetical protein J1614_006939 [Plenodomus biglobosus]|nr:hypothetical protein J1614_006939 [Plenodomus biglobosus]